MVGVTVQTRQLRKLQRVLGHIQNGVPKAMAGAINKTLNKGRTEIKREIRKDYLIKAKDIPMKIRGANAGRLAGEIKIEQGMLALNKFKVSPKGVQRRKQKRPLFAQVKKSGGGIIASGFVAATGRYTGPFVRAGSSSLPIDKLWAIGAPIMATQPNVGPAANKAMGDALDKNVDNQIKRILASAGGHS